MAAPLFPKRVDLDKASINQLLQLFSDSSQDLQGYLLTLNGQTISRSNVAQVRSQIQARIQTLGVAVGAWVSTTIPQQYAQGQYDAARQQDHFGEKAAAAVIIAGIANMSAVTARNSAFEAKNGLGFIPGEIISPKQEMFDLHRQSIQAISDSMSKSFGTSLTSMARSADKTVSSVQALGIRAEIARQADAGTNTQAISKKIADLIRDNDIAALEDASGRMWSPENYADMLVKTKLTEARNNGMMDALTSVGQDLVEVSSHGATDACDQWEGEILSIAGDSELYPSVSDATDSGLFHPRCQHSLNAVDPTFYPNSMVSSEVTVAEE